MGYFRIISVFVLLLPSAALSRPDNKPKTSQRIGDLLVTLLGVGKRDSPRGNDDHYIVTVRFKAENVGKHALCVIFKPTLKASFDLEYRGSVFSEGRLRITELLPGEVSEGEYDFAVKNGVEPLRVILRPDRETQSCGGNETASSIWHGKDQVEFDLTNSLAPAVKADSPLETQQEQTQHARAFLVGAKGSPPQPNAIKAFRDHCPRVVVTTQKENANYTVELTPSSLTRSKNTVVVVNAAGDIIHSGATLGLRNAAKDACVSILNDFSANNRE